MTDRFTIRVVVIGLAAAVLAGVGFLGYLATTGTAIPDQLDRLVTFLAGGFVGLLTKTSSGDTPTPVVGENGGPVLVADERGQAYIGLVVVGLLVVIILLATGRI